MMNELYYAFYMTIELWIFLAILLVAMIVKGEF
jgi:hypothetical protein